MDKSASWEVNVSTFICRPCLCWLIKQSALFYMIYMFLPNKVHQDIQVPSPKHSSPGPHESHGLSWRHAWPFSQFWIFRRFLHMRLNLSVDFFFEYSNLPYFQYLLPVNDCANSELHFDWSRNLVYHSLDVDTMQHEHSHCRGVCCLEGKARLWHIACHVLQ